jgi:hypothetical protein
VADAAQLEVSWEGGGSGRFTALDGENVKLTSGRPFAPGSRPTGTLTGGLEVRLKVHRSKKTSDAPPTWNVEGRMLAARRELLTELRARLDASASGEPPAG